MVMDWACTASAGLAFLLYYNTLDAGFVYDDRRAIVTNPDVVGAEPPHRLFENDFWGTSLSDPGSHGSYRPLCVATFRFNYLISGLRPWSFHLINVLLHCLATVLVVKLSRKLLTKGSSDIGATVAGLSFAAHPIHTEAVAGIVGRADLTACNLFLISFFIYIKHVNLRNDETKKFYKPTTFHRCSGVRLPDIAENGPFRLSCHGVVEQIISSFKRFLSSGGTSTPFKLLHNGINRRSAIIRNKCKMDLVRRQCCVNLCYMSVSDNCWKSWLSLMTSILVAIASTLCKEPGITVLPVCIIYDIIKGAQERKLRSKKRLRSIWILCISTIVILILRWHITGGTPGFAKADNPTSKEPDILTRFYTFSYLPVFNLMLLIWPTVLSFDWSMDAVPRIKCLFEARNILSFIIYIILWKVISNCGKAVFLNHVNKSEIDVNHSDNRNRNYLKKYRNSYYNNNYEIKRVCYRDGRNHYSSYREKMRDRSHCYRILSETKIICPCIGCQQSLTENHTLSCRTMNNNNSMTQHSECSCLRPVAAPKYSIADSVEKAETISQHGAVLIALSFLIIPFVPATNLLFYVGFVVAERVLYIPSIGYCLLLGLGASKMCNWKVGKYWRTILLAFMLIAFSARTLRRNLDWRDEESLFRSAVDVNPPKAYGNLGSVLSSQLRYAEAEAAYRKALIWRPNMADVHYNLGVLLHSEKRFADAIKSFERAIHFRPTMAIAYVNLGVALIEEGRFAEATSVLRVGSTVEGKLVRDRREHEAARISALVQLAGLYAKRKNWKKALSTYRDALEYLPKRTSPLGWSRHNILTLVGEVHAQLAQWDEAEVATRAALAADPLHTPAHLFLATLLARNSTRALEAEQWFKRAVRLSPDNADIRHYYGDFLQNQKRTLEASEQFVRSVELSPQDAGRAAIAARALRESGQCESAEFWYSRVVQLTPMDAEAHSNLGAILHLNGKYSAAAASYRKALKLQPSDGVIITNLNRLRTIMLARDTKTFKFGF